MTREEAISEWTFRSNHIKKWLDEYGEEPSIRHYVELIDMAIEALSADAVSREECNCVFSKPKIKFPKKAVEFNFSNIEVVVRCKDCRHGWYDDDIEYYTCRHPKGLNEELYGGDFCSHGERKEE